MSDYFDSGYVVRKPAWHGLAEVHEDYPGDWNEARRWGGIEWDPEVEPIWSRRLTDEELLKGIQATLEATPEVERAERLLELFRGSMQEAKGYQRCYRNDDYSQTLGTMTTRWQPINHAEFGEIFEAILKQKHIRWETAGSVEKGKATWALALLDEPVRIGPDASYTLPYMALTARHDGFGGVRLQDTTIRVVCANTIKAAEAEADKNGTVFTFQHAEHWRDKLEQAEQAVMGIRDQFAGYREWAEHMADLKISTAQEEQFLVEFVPMPPDALVSDRVVKNVETARQMIRDFLNGPTVDGAGIRGTGFGLLQASVEFLDWGRKAQSSATRFNRQVLQVDKVKTQAADLILEIAGS